MTGFKRNPSGYSRAVEAYTRELDDADALLNDFAGRSAREVISVSKKPVKAGLVVGNLEGVMYSTVRDGKQEKYLHRFKRDSRPLLIADHDGSSIDIVGGRYRFTDRGIVDD